MNTNDYFPGERPPELGFRPERYGLSEVFSVLTERIRETQCGVTWDGQDVETYDGTLGVTQAFVSVRQAPVGSIRWNNNLAQIYDGPGDTPGNVNDQRWCSGTLIANNLFLTAGHCVDAEDTNGWQLPRRNNQIIPPDEIAQNMLVDFNFQRDPSGEIRPVQTYAVTGLVEHRLGGLDYAVLQLAGDPGALHGTTVVSERDANLNDMLCIIGHPEGMPKQIEAGPATGFTATQIRYSDIDTLGGNSGSGILQGDNGWIVGVHTNGGCTTNGGFNVGVKISAIVKVSPLMQRIASFPVARVDALVPYKDGVLTAFYRGKDPWGIHYSLDGLHLGGGGNSFLVYEGKARVDALVPYKNGVLAAFYHGNDSWGIYFSLDGLHLGGGENNFPVYEGKARVDALVPYKDGVLTAFYRGSKSWGIYFSPDGFNLGGGGNTLTVYEGKARVDALVPYKDGVLTAFRGSNSWGIYFSPDGFNLGGGGNTLTVYEGKARVDALVPYKGGVLTAFYRGSKSWGIHYSLDGLHLGGGANTFLVYEGKARVDALVPYKDGVLTAFYHGNDSWGIHYSLDGLHLGGGANSFLVYEGKARVDALVPYKDGVLTAFYHGNDSWGIYYSPDGFNLGGGGNTFKVYGA